MVNEVVPRRDGIICKVIVRNRNYQEYVDRYTKRSVPDLVLIHWTDKLNLMEELGKVASIANKEYEAKTFKILFSEGEQWTASLV